MGHTRFMSPLLHRLSATALMLAIVASLLASASLGTYLYNTWLGKPAAVEQFEQMNESLDQVSDNLSDLVRSGYRVEDSLYNMNDNLRELRRAINNVCSAVEAGNRLKSGCRR